MSIVIIEKVNNIKKSINYCLYKSAYTTTFSCHDFTASEEFEDIYKLRKERANKDTKNKARMIYQSFNPDDNITPELAHQIGVEFAHNYFDDKHQFLVFTHTDSDVIHNHIIFNEVRLDNYMMFNTSRKNTLHRLRDEDNKLSEKYGLSLNPEMKRDKDKNKRTTQKEYIARAKGNSFKEKLENVIDECLANSDNYEQFLHNMKASGYEYKEGKYLAFLNTKSNKYMRSKTLGFHYTENSIRYRIEHKDYQIHKLEYLLKKQWIDKSAQKYQESYGLRKWASKQNIEYLQELSRQVINEKKTIQEVLQHDQEVNILERAQAQLHEIDDELHQFKKMNLCFEDYQASFELIQNYKKAEDKQAFKQQHYDDFKKFDIAKKQMCILKSKYNITSEEDFKKFQEDLKNTRDTLYQTFNEEMKQQQKKQQHKRQSR